MTTLARVSLIVVACVAFHACSSARPVPAATSAAPQRIVLEDKTLTNEEVQQVLAQGYKPVGRNGKVYYCRREQVTGTNVPSTMCMTADTLKQLQEREKSGTDALADMEHGSSVLRTPLCRGSSSSC